MIKNWKAACWLGVLGVAWLTPHSAHGWDSFSPKGKIATKVCTWIEVYHMKRLTPWYAYFPSDPTMMDASPGNAYPTWPGSFPPPQAPWAGQHVMVPAGDSLGFYQDYPAIPAGQFSAPAAGYGPAPGFQPVSNSRTSAPSYWFAR
jgi:hypothetical protein